MAMGAPALAQETLSPDEIACRECEAQQRQAERPQLVVMEEAPRVSECDATFKPSLCGSH